MKNQTTIERQKLIARSNQAKAVQNAIMLSTGEIVSINKILKLQLHQDTGAKVLLRFDDWSKAGFTVIRKSKSVRIWGKKIKATNTVGFDPKTYAFYPMCCLFDESQVIARTDNVNINNIIRTHAVSDADMAIIQ